MRQQDRDLDTSFGVYVDRNNIPKIGSKSISIFGDNIIIDGKLYRGTLGLWSLITEKNPKDDDLEACKELMEQTNALHRDFDPDNPNPRSNKSKKWEKILKPIEWKVYQLLYIFASG